MIKLPKKKEFLMDVMHENIHIDIYFDLRYANTLIYGLFGQF